MPTVKKAFFWYKPLPGLEIPGGLIDPGETAQEAAVCELFEETGQTAARECLLGRLEVGEKSGTKRTGLLYGREVITLRPFTANEEIVELALWCGQKIGVDYTSQVSEIDRRLVALYSR